MGAWPTAPPHSYASATPQVPRFFTNTSVSAVKVHIVKWSIYLDQRKNLSVYVAVAGGKRRSGRVEQNKKIFSFVNHSSWRSFGVWKSRSIHASACLPTERVSCTGPMDGGESVTRCQNTTTIADDTTQRCSFVAATQSWGTRNAKNHRIPRVP